MKRHSPATERNRAPILEVLREVLPEAGTVLEVASGAGEHAAFLAAHFPRLRWLPTDSNPENFASIASWVADAGVVNVAAPAVLDASADVWPVATAAAIVCINMIHIASWAAAEGLFAGAQRIVPSGGVVYLYGPFIRDGVETAPSNLAFDASLRARDPQWGVRRLAEVEALAVRHGFSSERIVEMPANNLSVIFRKCQP